MRRCGSYEVTTWVDPFGRDQAAAALLTGYAPLTSASPLSLVGTVPARVIETAGGYVLLPGSFVTLNPAFGNADPERASCGLEDIHASVLVPGPRWTYPKSFATLHEAARLEWALRVGHNQLASLTMRRTC